MNACTVSDNTAIGGGGGIYNRGTLTLERSTVCQNSASEGGGIFNAGQLTVTESTVAQNDASGDGGGVLIESWCDLANSTVSGNTAGGNGGGVSVSEKALAAARTEFIHCTVTDNTASTRQGAGIFMFQGGTLRCRAAADANDDEEVNIADALWTMEFLFRGGPSPPPPFPLPGLGTTPGPLFCER